MAGWIFSVVAHFLSSATNKPEGLLKQEFVIRKLTMSVFSDHNYPAEQAE